MRKLISAIFLLLMDGVLCDMFAKNASNLTEYQLNERLKKRETIEFKHGGYTYFVCADSLIQQGGIKPLEMVEHEVKELLVNSKRADFIKNKKRSLYDDALKSGEIIIF
jgi:hypothetical protein